MNYTYILESIGIGVFATLVYAWVMYAIPVKSYLKRMGVYSGWAILLVVLFVFGFEKHIFEYYALVGSGYCKTRDDCSFPSIDKITVDKALQFTENMWIAAFYEGISFIFVGVPLFLVISNGYLVAFLTGFLTHVFAEWIGLNADICATNCNSSTSS